MEKDMLDSLLIQLGMNIHKICILTGWSYFLDSQVIDQTNDCISFQMGTETASITIRLTGIFSQQEKMQYTFMYLLPFTTTIVDKIRAALDSRHQSVTITRDELGEAFMESNPLQQ